MHPFSPNTCHFCFSGCPGVGLLLSPKSFSSHTVHQEMESENQVPIVDIIITSLRSMERTETNDSDMGLLEPLNSDHLEEWDDVRKASGDSLFQQKLASMRSRVLESRQGTPETTLNRPSSPTMDEMIMLQNYHHSLQSLADAVGNVTLEPLFEPIVRRTSSTPSLQNGRFSPVPRPSSAASSAVSNTGPEQELLGLLTLEIVSASDLPQGGDFVPSMVKTCNPFVVVSFGKKSWKTPYANAYDRYPSFGQTYHVPVHTGAEVERDSITFSVYIWNYLRRNLLVGTAELKVSMLLDMLDAQDRRTVSSLSEASDLPSHGRWTPDFLEEESSRHQTGEATSLFEEEDDDVRGRNDLGEPYTPKLKELNIALQTPPTAAHSGQHKPHVRIRIGWSDHHQLLKNLCLYLFDVHDADGNGRLNRFEMEAVLETAGANLSLETQDSMFLNRGQDPETGDLDLDQVVESMEEVIEHVLTGIPMDVASSVASSDSGSEDEAPHSTWERVVDIHHCPMCRLLLEPGQRIQLEHLLVCCSANPNRDSTAANGLVGFLTEEYASRKWITQVLRRWGYGKYIVGGQGGHVLVLDRRTGRVREELLPTYVNVGIRLMYQNYYARTAVQSRALLRLFKTLTLREGRKYSHPKSTKKIPGFIKRYRLDLNEIRDPLSSFQSTLFSSV
jgi:phosphatidylserine decarboxylase